MEISSTSAIGSTVHAPAESAAPVPQQQRALVHAIRAVNAAELFGHDNELTFIMDRETRRAVVRIVNRDTCEVIQQIPAEYVLRMAEEISGT